MDTDTMNNAAACVGVAEGIIMRIRKLRDAGEWTAKDFEDVHAALVRIEDRVYGTAPAVPAGDYAFRVVKVQDPRTPGHRWFEVWGRNRATGYEWQVGEYDVRDDAREIARQCRERHKAAGGARPRRGEG